MTDSGRSSEHPMSGATQDRAAPAERRRQRRHVNKRQRYAKMTERRADEMPVVEAMDGPRQTRVVDAPMREPAPRGGLRAVFSRRYLLRLIVRRELAQMYSASVLGLFWSYVQPAVRFGMYYFVMGVVFAAHKSVPYFAIHLFCGMVFVHYFTETFNGGTRSIVQNRQMVKKMAMPREVFPVASSVVALYHTVPQMILLTTLCIFLGFHFTFTGLAAAVLGMAIMMVFGLALALLFSAANVFFRDFQNLVTTVTYFVHFIVPMMYPYSLVSKHIHGWHLQVYLANPMATATMLVQKFFWHGVCYGKKITGLPADVKAQREALAFPPHLLERGLITLAILLVALAISQRVFTKLESKFPERL